MFHHLEILATISFKKGISVKLLCVPACLVEANARGELGPVPNPVKCRKLFLQPVFNRPSSYMGRRRLPGDPPARVSSFGVCGWLQFFEFRFLVSVLPG